MSTEQDTTVTESQDTEAADATEQVADTESTEKSAETPKPSAEDKKAQIVDSFQKRLDSGELTIEEVETRQPWVAEAIKLKQGESQEPSGDKLKATLKSELLEELSVEQTFRAIDSLGLSKDKKTEIRQLYEKLKESLGSREALDTALQAKGVDISPEAMRRKNMALPELGEGVMEGDPEVTESDKAVAQISSVKPEKVAKYRTSLEKTGRITRPLL